MNIDEIITHLIVLFLVLLGTVGGNTGSLVFGRLGPGGYGKL